MKKVLLSYFTVVFSVCIVYSQENKEVDWAIDIIDSTQYDIDFLQYWKQVKPYPVRIVNDSIIINDESESPVLIPTDLGLDQVYNYKCEVSDTSYILTIKRVNYTNIEYFIEGTANEVVVFGRKGVAILEPSFYLAAEGLFERGEDEVYNMNDYNIVLNDLGEIKLLIPEGTDKRIDYIEQQGARNIYLSFDKLENKQ